jgi:hypothetical protein
LWTPSAATTTVSRTAATAALPPPPSFVYVEELTETSASDAIPSTVPELRAAIQAKRKEAKALRKHVAMVPELSDTQRLQRLVRKWTGAAQTLLEEFLDIGTQSGAPCDMESVLAAFGCTPAMVRWDAESETFGEV